MFRAISLLFAAITQIFRLRNKNANRKTRKGARALLSGMNHDKAMQLLAELDMPVRRKPVGDFEAARLASVLEGGKGRLVNEKLRLLDLYRVNDHTLIVVGEGKSQEVIPGRYANSLADRFYNCVVCLTQEETEWNARAAFPDDKEHQYLLEDFADRLYVMGMPQTGAAAQ